MNRREVDVNLAISAGLTAISTRGGGRKTGGCRSVTGPPPLSELLLPGGFIGLARRSVIEKAAADGRPVGVVRWLVRRRLNREDYQTTDVAIQAVLSASFAAGASQPGIEPLLARRLKATDDT